MIRKILASLLIFLLMTSIGEAANLTNKTEVKNLRYSLTPGKVRIVVDMSRQVEYTEAYLEYPSRLIVSFKNTWIDVKKMKKDIEINSSAASRIKVAQYDPTTVRVVIETVAATNLFWLSGGPSGQRFVIDLTDPNFVPEPEPETKKPETKKPDTKKTDDKETDEPFTNKIENETPNTYKEDDRKPSKQDDKKSDGKDNQPDEKTDSGDENLSELDKDLENITGLKGKIIVIDAGHGGGDSGAIGPTGVTEKSVTLRIALELEKLLKDEGAKVVMTRRTDKQVRAIKLLRLRNCRRVVMWQIRLRLTFLFRFTLIVSQIRRHVAQQDIISRRARAINLTNWQTRLERRFVNNCGRPVAVLNPVLFMLCVIPICPPR